MEQIIVFLCWVPTEVKELGVVIYNCSRLAHDLIKIFNSYWMMSHRNASIPEPWPVTFDTLFNHEHPLLVNLSGIPSSIYISVRSIQSF